MSNVPDFTMKQNDTGPPFEIVVMTGLREVVDLTGVTAPEFHMRRRRTKELVVDATAEISNAIGGLLAYNWAAGDTDTPGLYEAEFQITLPNGEGTISIPNDGHYLIEIVPEIA